MKNNEIRDLKTMLPMNIQFFAESDGSDAGNGAETSSDGAEETVIDESEQTPTKTYEDALAEIAAAQAEAKKLKAERDAALKKSGDIAKQLRAKMSEAELQAEQKAQEDEERQAHLKELEAYKAENEALKRYRLQGMDEELAGKAAKAEIEGDMDALADVQRQYTQALLKEKEAEWKKSRPRVNMGDGEDSTSMTKDEIMAIKDPKERQIAIAKNLKQFGY